MREGLVLCPLKVKVVPDAGTLQETDFWKSMHRLNWVFLVDKEGGGRNRTTAPVSPASSGQRWTG